MALEPQRIAKFVYSRSQSFTRSRQNQSFHQSTFCFTVYISNTDRVTAIYMKVSLGKKREKNSILRVRVYSVVLIV